MNTPTRPGGLGSAGEATGPVGATGYGASTGPGGASSPSASTGPGREDVGRVFTALADPTRRRLLDTLGRRSACSATTLARDLPVSRQAVVQQLAILQESELVESRRVGREVLFSVQPQRLLEAASWMTDLAASWDERLLALKREAESGPGHPGPGGPAPAQGVSGP